MDHANERERRPDHGGSRPTSEPLEKSAPAAGNPEKWISGRSDTTAASARSGAEHKAASDSEIATVDEKGFPVYGPILLIFLYISLAAAVTWLFIMGWAHVY